MNENKNKDDSKGINLDNDIFKTSSLYNVGSFVLMIILAFIYAFFW